jgi:tryptophan 2,3-dioxygenase
MQRNRKPCYYSEYLHLDKLLDSQHPVSKEYGNEAHDEMLFIITHQSYELWFRQILHELKAIDNIFSSEKIDERELGSVNHKMDRIIAIQKVLVDQLGVLETMTPMDFLEFRDYLIPASGFQSIQFKQIEIILGLNQKNRVQFDKESFYNRLNETDRNNLTKLEGKPTMFDNLEAWLSRMPFIQTDEFSFWESYQSAVTDMLDRDQETIIAADYMPDESKQFQLNDLQNTRLSFSALLNEEKYNELLNDGQVRLSQRAMLAALFINLYRDEPILHAPFRVLTNLLEIDELFTKWRYNHVLMVQRMLGKKIGTGGSSGTDYLKSTTQNNRFFNDLFTLSTYLIPRSQLPKLPVSLKKQLDFHFGHNL